MIGKKKNVNILARCTGVLTITAGAFQLPGHRSSTLDLPTNANETKNLSNKPAIFGDLARIEAPKKISSRLRDLNRTKLPPEFAILRSRPQVVPILDDPRALMFGFQLSAHSPFYYAIDGLAGMVHTLEEDMFLPHWPKLPESLARYKHFVFYWKKNISERYPNDVAIKVVLTSSKDAANYVATRSKTLEKARRTNCGFVAEVNKPHSDTYEVPYCYAGFATASRLVTDNKTAIFNTREEAKGFCDNLWNFKLDNLFPFGDVTKDIWTRAFRVPRHRYACQFFSILKDMIFQLGSDAVRMRNPIRRRFLKYIVDEHRAAKNIDELKKAGKRMKLKPSDVSNYRPKTPSELMRTQISLPDSVKNFKSWKDMPTDKLAEVIAYILPPDPYKTQRILSALRKNS